LETNISVITNTYGEVLINLKLFHYPIYLRGNTFEILKIHHTIHPLRFTEIKVMSASWKKTILSHNCHVGISHRAAPLLWLMCNQPYMNSWQASQQLTSCAVFEQSELGPQSSKHVLYIEGGENL